MEIFKEQISGLLLDQKKLEEFNDLPPPVKSSFTKTYNTIQKNIIRDIKKSSNSRSGNAGESSRELSFIRSNIDMVDIDDDYASSDKETPDKDSHDLDDKQNKTQAKKAPARSRAKK